MSNLVVYLYMYHKKFYETCFQLELNIYEYGRQVTSKFNAENMILLNIRGFEYGKW